MHLSYRKTALLIAFTSFACRDATGPGTLSAQFELTDINGRALPTYPAPTPGLTPTILSGSVVLDKNGEAVIIEHQTQWNGADFTSTIHFTYKITANQIEFQLPPAPIDPITPPRGTISAAGLTLEMGRFGSGVILYDYRVVHSP